MNSTLSLLEAAVRAPGRKAGGVGLHPDVIRDYADQGLFASYKDGGRVRIDRADFTKWCYRKLAARMPVRPLQFLWALSSNARVPVEKVITGHDLEPHELERLEKSLAAMKRRVELEWDEVQDYPSIVLERIKATTAPRQIQKSASRARTGWVRVTKGARFVGVVDTPLRPRGGRQ